MARTWLSRMNSDIIGMPAAARMPMIATTTAISIMVKPRGRRQTARRLRARVAATGFSIRCP